MTTNLQRFLDNCKTMDRIVSVEVEDAHDLHMDHIADAYTFAEHPQLFRFKVTCDNGNPRAVNIVIPLEMLEEFDRPPIHELIAAANRHNVVSLENHIYFLRPDVKDSVCFRGHELNPIQSPEEPLATLMTMIRNLPNVESAEVYKVVDPAIHKEADCEDAVIINAHITGLPYKDIIRADTDLCSDSFQITLPKHAYSDSTKFPNLMANIIEGIDNLNK